MRRILLVASAILVAAVLTAPAAAASTQSANAVAACRALLYLHGDQSAGGAVAIQGDLTDEPGATEDFIFGTAAAGYDPKTLKAASGKSVYDFLAADFGPETSTAGGTAKLMLARFAGRFPVAHLAVKLATFYDASTGAYGDGETFNQVLALLALKEAGQTVPAKAITYLRAGQDTDGGWNYLGLKDNASSGGSDTNSTAVAIEGLIATGAAKTDPQVVSALAFLKTQQNADGGFPYQGAPAAPGSPSDPDSDAVVIQALKAAGQDPTSAQWTLPGGNPLSNLMSQQRADGGFFYPGDPQAPVHEPLTTAEVPAGLLLAPLPVAPGYPTGAALPRSCTAAAAAAATATPKPGLPATGGPGSSPALAILVLLMGAGLSAGAMITRLAMSAASKRGL